MFRYAKKSRDGFHQFWFGRFFIVATLQMEHPKTFDIYHHKKRGVLFIAGKLAVGFGVKNKEV